MCAFVVVDEVSFRLFSCIETILDGDCVTSAGVRQDKFWRKWLGSARARAHTSFLAFYRQLTFRDHIGVYLVLMILGPDGVMPRSCII